MVSLFGAVVFWQSQQRLLGRLVESRAIRALAAFVIAVFALVLRHAILVSTTSRRLSQKARVELEQLRLTAQRRRQQRELTPQHRCSLCPNNNRTNTNNNKYNNKATPLRVLCLDGGGFRSVVSCAVLARLIRRFPNLMENIDLVCGTGTGGFIAVGLANGSHPEEILQAFAWSGPAILSMSERRVAFGMNGIFAAKFGNKGRIDALKCVFGDDLSTDALLHHILIPCIEITPDSISPQLFCNFPPPQSNNPATDQETDEIQTSEESWTEVIWKLVAATTGVPTYFPTFNRRIDGGMFANNPANLAVAKAAEYGIQPDAMVVLSISTCHKHPAAFVQSGDVDWGLAQWAPHLASVITAGSSACVDFACRTLLGDRYFRWHQDLEAELAVEQLDEMQSLVETAKKFDLTKLYEFVEKNMIREGKD
eukprot:c9836_g1_i1.p1 GENE.c9836_g1_i1~~c9836_g1_i1.p1  ORF type:complete len:424 (+),score=101.65 c9836_g1_i1:27-1298(+)